MRKQKELEEEEKKRYQSEQDRSRLMDMYSMGATGSPEYEELRQKLQYPSAPERTGIADILGGMEGYDPTITLDEYGMMKSTSLKPQARPTVGSEVAQHMKGLTPGSPEWKEAAKITSGGTTVNVGTGASPLEKSTKGAIERSIEEIDDILLTLQEVDKLTEDSFLTYGGQIKAKGTKLGEKITGQEFSSSPFLQNYSQWQMLSQDLYLKKRKQITGVAARPEEAAEIAKAIPDPTKDSPSQFRSKQILLQNIMKKHRDRLVKLRAIGIKNPTKEQLAAIPLDAGKTENLTIEDIDRELAEIDRQLGIR
jgi:hypothetical protein